VRGLADKIAANVGTTRNISLDVRNISSMSQSEAGAAQRALESELAQRQFRIVPSTSAVSSPLSDAPAGVRVTFSEGVEGLVWVAEIRSSSVPGDSPQVAIVSTSKVTSDMAREPKVSLTLNRKLIWEQPDKFLDFATIPQSTTESAALLILEPGRLALYRSSNSRWQLSQTAAIARSSAQSRDISGRIDIAAQEVTLTGLKCAGNLQQPQSLNCAAASSPLKNPQLKIAGLEEIETAQLDAKCGDANIVLVTGNGDWTQPDSIQGIELPNPQAVPIALSDPMAMDGPVISLWAPPNEENDARAIVYNLKTNRYEGYVVTATCNH
jgi:hypothetical protein